jgi:hypothetical protein
VIVREVILDELIVRFDGTIVELLWMGRASERHHVLHLARAELLELDSRRGPTLNLEGKQRGGVALTHLALVDGQLAELQALVGEIEQAIRSAPRSA